MIRTISFILLLALLTQVGCADKVESKESVATWFAENQAEIVELRDTVLSHPNIKRVESAEMEFVSSYGEFSKDDLEAYKTVLQQSQDLGIKSISVGKKGAALSGKLINVSMVVISKGITGAGYALAIEYIPDSGYIELAKEHNILFSPLTLENWYLVEYTGN
ncbi:MAG: hypothetical protein WEA82_05460 [Idiomarina sp.]